MGWGRDLDLPCFHTVPTELAVLLNQLSAFSSSHTTRASHEDTHDPEAAASSFRSSVPCPRSGRDFFLRFCASLLASGASNRNPSIPGRGEEGFLIFSSRGWRFLAPRSGSEMLLPHPPTPTLEEWTLELRPKRGPGVPEERARPEPTRGRGLPAGRWRLRGWARLREQRASHRCCSRETRPTRPGERRGSLQGPERRIGGGAGAEGLRDPEPAGAGLFPRGETSPGGSEQQLPGSDTPPPFRLPRHPTFPPSTLV